MSLIDDDLGDVLVVRRRVHSVPVRHGRGSRGGLAGGLGGRLLRLGLNSLQSAENSIKLLGGPSGCTLPFVDFKTKVPSQDSLLIQGDTAP